MMKKMAALIAAAILAGALSACAAQPAQAASAPSKDSGQQEAGFSDLNAFINIPDGALDEELPFA